LVPSPESKGIDSQSPQVTGKLLGEAMHGEHTLYSGLLYMLDQVPVIRMI
jgi:hypothetical protein